MKVLIAVSAEAYPCDFSLEAGMADGVAHFDHHRPEHRHNPAPCRDERIPVAKDGDTIVITHMDADTFVGLLRLSGGAVPTDLGFDLMEEIDLNGSSVCPNPYNTLLYMLGVGQMARDLKFPRPSADGPVDVTSLVEAIMAKTEEKIIDMGRRVYEKSEAAYRDCKVAVNGPVGFWVIGPDDAFDPSRPYQDGVEVVVVFRRHYESISIYCSPASDKAFGGQEIAGIQFAGHPKAAGSPRGVAFAEQDARMVYEALF